MTTPQWARTTPAFEGVLMSFFRRRRKIDPEAFGSLLAERLSDAGAQHSMEQAHDPLPGNPWARRLIVALHTHTDRQRWVAKVVREHLHADPLTIAASGHPGIPAGQVQGLSGWAFRFHGIGCCLTHDDGTVIDVDFDELGADSVGLYAYGWFLASSPGVRGVEATLKRPKPLDEWWMAEVDCLRRLGWVQGDHRVRVTPLGTRWATVLRPGFEVMAVAPDASQRLRAALLLEDFQWAAQMEMATDEVQERAAQCSAVRASELERNLRWKRSWTTFTCLAVHDPARATRRAAGILLRGPLDGLTSTALAYLQATDPGPAVEVLLKLARRAKGTAPPAPHLRTEAVAGILRRYRSDSLPAELREQILDVLLPESYAGEGLSALLHTLLDYESGLKRLGRSLRHAVPVARAEAAAALAMLGTPEAAEVLRAASDTTEAKAALALLRGFSPDPGPTPQGHVIQVRGRPQRVFTIGELMAADCPSLVQSSLEQLSKDLGALLQRWWAQ